jgi:uncharacterized protein YkwD
MIHQPQPSRQASRAPRLWLALGVVLWAGSSLGCSGDEAQDDEDAVATLVSECRSLSAGRACQLYRRVNEERRSHGLALYSYDAALARAAQSHADDMAANDYISHTSLDGTTFDVRILLAGYDGFPRAENIAQAPDVDAVMLLWLSSEGHRETLLWETSTETGIGVQGELWVLVTGREP